MTISVKEALRLEAFKCLADYKNANAAKKRALVRGDLEDLIEFEALEGAEWEKLKLAVDAFIAEPPVGSLMPVSLEGSV